MKIPGFKNRSVLVNWSLSYISILLIPVIISMAVYISSENILKTEITRTNSQLLNQVKNAIDNRLKDIERTALQMSFNQNVKSIPSHTTHFDKIANYNSIIRELRVYKLSNSFVDNFYIYIRENECAVSGSSYLPEKFFVSNTGGYKGINEIQWQQTVLQNDMTEFIPLLSIDDPTSCKAVAYTKPIYIGNRDLNKVLLIITIESSRLLENLNTIDFENESSTLIIDRNNVIISSTLQNSAAGLIGYQDLSMNSGMFQTVKGDQKLTVLYTTSDVNDWKYVTVIPTEIFRQKIDFITQLIYFSIVLSLVIGFIVIHLSVKFNYNPMERLIKILSTNSGIISDKKVNEFKFIQQAVEQTINEKEKALSSVRSHKPIVKTNLLSKLLKGSFDWETSLMDTLMQYDIKFETEYFLVILFYIDQNSKFFHEEYDTQMSLKEKQKLSRFIISNIIEELINQEYYGIATEIDNMVCCIVNFKEKPTDLSLSDISRHVRYAAEIIQDKFKIDIKVSISRVKKSASKIPEAYTEAFETVEYKKIMGINDPGFIEIKCVRHDEGLKSLYDFPLQMEQKLINCVKAGDFESSQEVINEIYEKNLLEASPSLIVIKCLMFDLISTMFKTMNEINGFCDNRFLEELDPINRLTECTTVFDMKKNLIYILSMVCQYINDNRKNDHRNIKDNVIEYVNQNYNNVNLNISAIAEQFNITPAYLSKIFKEQSNIALMDYINEVRLKKAKELLKNKKSNVSDIAAAVGFQNTNTFIRVFKKYEGITPGKYKDTIS